MGTLNDNEKFRHVEYHFTDVRKTWARERKRLADLKVKQEAEQAEQATKVRKIKAAP